MSHAVQPGLAQSLKSAVEKYLAAFPAEEQRLRALHEFVNKTPEAQMCSRKNFVGHITASGFVLSPDRRKLLFLNHKYLKRYLQPGGHVDPIDETVFSAAVREIREETGHSSPMYIPFHLDYFLPIDIDTHHIPANPTKGEPAHVHHDFRFLFYVDSEVDLDAERETNDGELTWVDLEQAREIESHKHVIDKIRIALSQEFLSRKFFRAITELAQYPRRCASVVVTHILPDVLSYLHALSGLSYLQAVISKPNSIVESIKENLDKQFPIVALTRAEISDGQRLFELLNTIEGDFLLFDIGGYFAPICNVLAKRYGDRCLGVIEDTENGHQKYHDTNEREQLRLPVISVARSPLKETEDFLVGQSILFSADSILRQSGLLIQYTSCAVFGFGKIGRSICHHLLLRGIKPSVYDSNSILRVQAKNQLFLTPPRETLLSEAGVLFCATGSRCLDLLDFRRLRAGCFVFSVTSSDDEFDTTFLHSEYNNEQVVPHVFRYSRPDHHFYLVNQGNAVNFIHNAVLGSFIHLVRAEMIIAGASLVRREFKPGLASLDDAHRNAVADLWLDTFNSGGNLATHFEIRDRDL